jgi:hypothetical protein
MYDGYTGEIGKSIAKDIQKQFEATLCIIRSVMTVPQH